MPGRCQPGAGEAAVPPASPRVSAGSDTAGLPTGDAPTWWPPVLGRWGPTGSPKCPSWGCAPTRALSSCPVILGPSRGAFQGLSVARSPWLGEHTQGQQVGRGHQGGPSLTCPCSQREGNQTGGNAVICAHAHTPPLSLPLSGGYQPVQATLSPPVHPLCPPAHLLAPPGTGHSLG